MASKKSEKDQAMAADLRRRGVKRTTLRCPICLKEVAVSMAYSHIAFHK